jgi:hypothetical protein
VTISGVIMDISTIASVEVVLLRRAATDMRASRMANKYHRVS